MSRWSHAICDNCWVEGNPVEYPVRLVQPVRERCCFCGDETESGIYVREDPKTAPCRGEGGFHAEAS